MSRVRPMSPADLIALVSCRGATYVNDAKVFERLGAGDAGPNPIETAIEPWFSFATGRRVWLSAQRGRLQDLVSVRRRGGRRAWEIDYLIETSPLDETLSALVSAATAEGGRLGVEKIFVRLAAASDHLATLRSAGFVTYANEILYARPWTAAAGASCLATREMSQADHYPAFRLYNAVQPEQRRHLEAVTYEEWQASLEQRWLRGGVQLVAEEQGQLSALVRAARLPQGLVVELLVGPGKIEVVEALIAAAATATASARERCLVLAPEGSALAAALEATGFCLQAEFTALVCRTAQVVRLGKLMPSMPRRAVVT